MAHDRFGLEVLSWRECIDLIAAHNVGRVGLSIYAQPAILPVSYALLGDNIVFGTGTGGKSLAAAHENVLAFEIDETDTATHTGWSVLVVGKCQRITEGDRYWYPAQELSLDPWVGRFADKLVRLPLDRVSGRRLIGPVPTDTDGEHSASAR